MKYYCSFEKGKMTIKELPEKIYQREPEFQKQRGEYEGVPVYDTLADAVKSLGGYCEKVTLPSGKTIIPQKENFNLPVCAYIGGVYCEIMN